MSNPVLQKAVNMLNNAQQKHNERVRVQMLLPGEVNATGVLELKLAVNTVSKANEGCVYITDGAQWPQNTYYGKVTKKGYWQKSGNATPEIASAVMAQLRNFTENPAEVARAYAQAKGNCCFCCRELTNPISVYAGYGPVCAAKYHLPYAEYEEAASKGIELDISDLTEEFN